MRIRRRVTGAPFTRLTSLIGLFAGRVMDTKIISKPA